LARFLGLSGFNPNLVAKKYPKNWAKTMWGKTDDAPTSFTSKK